ncbi:MAG: hypothetical protein GC154_09810 [bacterium]|nr:hypothetical protein [bacterium]
MFPAGSSILMMLLLANLAVNGDFEQGLTHWGALWTRAANAGRLSLDRDTTHDGRFAAKVEHSGENDWSLTHNETLPVKTGDLFELSAWLRVEGGGSASICAIARDAKGEVTDWFLGGKTLNGSHDWTETVSRFVIPQGVATIQPRVIGEKPATVWIDDFAIDRQGNIDDLRGDLPDAIGFQNNKLTVELNTHSNSFTVTDRRNGREWRQDDSAVSGYLLAATPVDDGVDLAWMDAGSSLNLILRWRLAGDDAELTLAIDGEGVMTKDIDYPPPFVTPAGSRVIVPMNEGISYPVEDASVNEQWLIAYGGHGICMPFWGAADRGAAMMAIFETPNDAMLRVIRRGGLLCGAPRWQAEMGRFGYERNLRYVFFDEGDHVEICKRYRAYARKTGLLKTFAEKKAQKPAIDLLLGAANIWCWESNALGIVNEMAALGMDRILWSHRESPSVIDAMNERGVLTSRYDIYQDVMDPANFSKIQYTHPDWPTAAWPDDLMLDENGNWRHGWSIEGKDGGWYDCGVLCDKPAPAYALERIGEELKTHAYRSRFIDTTTASPWRECYDPDHLMTRSDSRYYKMQLLSVVSDEYKLVCGSETGHDAAVPYADYFEGMLSLGPYRVPDAGRDMQRIWNEVPENISKFQLGQKYRLPLWELVYHDCVVAQWYWGDYNNKLPAVWDKRDLFNVLYGTPPMYMFTYSYWKENKERFAASYQRICPLVRRIAASEMIDHRILTDDWNVQQTVYANGFIVTVNFSDEPYRLNSEVEIAANDYSVQPPANCIDWRAHE